METKYLVICVQDGGDVQLVKPFVTYEQANDFIAKSAAEMYDKIHEKFTSGIDVWHGGAEVVDGEEVYSWQIYPLIEEAMKHTECPYCGTETNDFVMMNQTVEYSGIEVAVNRQGMLRTRVYDSNGAMVSQDIVEIKCCPLCGKRFVK